MGTAEAATKRTFPTELELRVQRADDALLAQVIQLVRNYTNWTWSHVAFDLVEQPIMAFTAVDRDTEQMVACALLAAPERDTTTSWVGYVVVANNVRRRGVATCLMQKLVEHACMRDDVQQIELVAAREGVMVYKSVGFEKVSEKNVCLMQYDMSKQQSFEIVHDVLILTDVPLYVRQEVADLYGSVAGNRSKTVQTLFKHGICVFDRHANGAIQAVAWLRRVQNKGVETWWLGPLISHQTSATKSIIGAAISYAQRHSKSAPGIVQTLSLNSSSTFEHMHFDAVAPVPLMRRAVTRLRTAHLERSEGTAREPLARYVSLCDYFAG